jgi:probable F420-dependent oxidoreductase
VSDPLRFGCQFQVLRGKREFLDTARRIEDLGFDVATFPDHFGGWASVWPSIVAAASVTSTLRLGPLTINNDLWNPVVLARDAVSADVFSGGRVELGLGAGWREADFAIAGIPQRAPRERIERLAESVAIVRGYCAPGAFEYDGRFHHVRVPADRLRPTQPHIPIFIGGGGRHILRVAATEADIVGVHVNLGGAGVAIGGRAAEPQAADDRGVLVDAVERRLAWIAGDRPASLAAPELHLYVLDVRRGPSSLRAAEATATSYGISPAAVVESPWFLTGPEEEMARKLVAINERYGISYFTVGEEHADTVHSVMGYI